MTWSTPKLYFRSARSLLTGIVIAFSATSVIVALTLGFVLSWAFVLPVWKMERRLADITAGDFDRVEVPTATSSECWREISTRTSERFAMLFAEQRHLATTLGETNASLEQASLAK